MEVRSEQGLMAGRDLFGMPKSPPAPPASAAMQSVRMAHTADGTPVFAPVTSAAPPSYQPQVAVHGPSMSTAAATGGNGAMASPSISEPVAKKRRGRPRKYGPDGSMSLALVPASSATGSPAMGQGSSGPFSLAGPNPANSVLGVSPDGVKKRGRPKGSTNKPRMGALGKISTSIILFFLMFWYGFTLKISRHWRKICSHFLMGSFVIECNIGIKFSSNWFKCSLRCFRGWMCFIVRVSNGGCIRGFTLLAF